MNFPPPTEKQARLIWISTTMLASGLALAAAGLFLWALGWLVKALSSVLLPLAIAGVAAYLLDPVVDFFERKRVPRTRAIILVFFLAVMLVLILLATVVPQIVVEANLLIDRIPEHLQQLRDWLSRWMEKSPWGQRTKEAWDAELGAQVQEWLATALPVVGAWFLEQLGRVASWAGLLAGLALVPVYTFYFLVEKKGIEGKWTDYLPLQESRTKEEAVFILNEINNCLIVFFRGQVLVAMCVGALLTVGFLAMGLNYAVLLGVVAGLLSIVPYLGVMMSIIPAVALAAVQFGDWLHPVYVVLIFIFAQMAEGLLISPKIIGDRVGLHPLTIIIAVMAGTTLLGGILGGVLAIPLTAALRTLMFRYVWKRQPGKKKAAKPS
ncbi:MAG: AI-2E family transporter [Verrucomicrobiota bacterium]